MFFRGLNIDVFFLWARYGATEGYVHVSIEL